MQQVNFDLNKRRLRRKLQKTKEKTESENLPVTPSTLNSAPSTSEGNSLIPINGENIETANESENIPISIVEPSTSIGITSNESFDLQNLCPINRIEKSPITEVMQSEYETLNNIESQKETVGIPTNNKTVVFPSKLKIYKKYQPLIKIRNVKICIRCKISKADMFFLPCKHGFCNDCASNCTKKFEKFLLKDIGLTKKEAKTISAACFKCALHIKETCRVFESI